MITTNLPSKYPCVEGRQAGTADLEFSVGRPLSIYDSSEALGPILDEDAEIIAERRGWAIVGWLSWDATFSGDRGTITRVYLARAA